MKKLYTCLLALLMAALLAVPARAEEHNSGNWQVTFTANKEMSSNFKSADMHQLFAGMQPGDTAVVSLTLTNQYGETTDWYMTNEVIKSLEDKSATAQNGAYTYRLVYRGPNSNADTVLYSSEVVGGEENPNGAGVGLNQATSSLEKYFYLDSLGTGQSGRITLTVGLDGETQGNDYQDTLAQLKMDFAVELNDTAPNILERTRSTTINGRRTTVVATGDEDLTLYYILAAVSGLVLLAFAVYSLKTQRGKGKGGRVR